MTRRPSPAALILVVALAGGYAAATPRSEVQHDVIDIPVSSPSVMPGARPWEDREPTGSHAALRSGAPSARPTHRVAIPTASPSPAPSLKPARPASHSAPKPNPTAPRPTALPRVTARHAVGHSLTGRASWYCLPGRSVCTVGYSAGCSCAAAGPAIRATLGSGWRGHIVTVRSGAAAVAVRLIDWCACPDGRLLDLYASAYSRLGPLSSGLRDVVVDLR